MKKKIILLTLLIATTLIAPVLAKAPTGPAGKSNIIQLLLVEKDAEWNPVKGGAFGKMTYNNMTGDYVFNGHRLEALTEYTLINFARVGTEWPATINELGDGTTNGGGNVHIEGNFAYADLEGDTTPATPGEFKIWLVLTNDLAGSTLSLWNPAEYLFEADLI
jgi:hypothetical protein